MKPVMSRVVLPIVIFVGGGLIAGALIMRSPKAKRHSTERAPTVVDVVEVTPAPAQAEVRATGVVTPSQKIGLSPEVSGRVVAIADDMLPGGRFTKGTVIARIDNRDYKLVIQQEESRVQKAELDLQLELGRAGIAAREWTLLGQGKDPKKATLALRKPQLAAAERNLEAARSGLERLRLNLERTTLRAPFNAMVLAKNVDVGQVVGPGSVLATLIGTDRFWVKISVAVDKLDLIDIPGVNAEQGSRVTIVQEAGAAMHVERSGEVLRLQGELEPQTRTAQLLVSVDQPLATQGDGPPLLPGSFVEVVIQGRRIEESVPIPRSALINGDSVWIVDGEEKLRRRQIEIGWRCRSHLFVVAGLSAGDRVVHSPIVLPIEGLPVVVTGSSPTVAARDAASRPAANIDEGARQ